MKRPFEKFCRFYKWIVISALIVLLIALLVGETTEWVGHVIGKVIESKDIGKNNYNPPGHYYLYNVGEGSSTTFAWSSKSLYYRWSDQNWRPDYIEYEIDPGTIVKKLEETGYYKVMKLKHWTLQSWVRGPCKVRLDEDVGQMDKGLEVWVACENIYSRNTGPLANETEY